MKSAAEITDLLLQATEHNRQDPLLAGSLLEFPDYGQLVMTGDMHGHRRNFDKLIRYCALEHSPARHVILHEIIHEEPESLTSRDRSFEVLFDAVAWKCEFPDQVHFMQSNHELSQLTGHEIAKNGRVVTHDFEHSIELEFGKDSPPLLDALYAFFRSFPLAARTTNRIFLAHSLPAPRDVPRFDPGILARAAVDSDFREGGSAYMLVWGRYQTEQELVALREILDADYFICGHQPQDDGYDVLHERMIILASDHNHGVFLPIDLKARLGSVGDLTSRIRPFAGVV